MNNKNFFRYLRQNHFFWKEFIFSIIIIAFLSIAFVLIFDSTKVRTKPIWDGLSIISTIILLVSFLVVIFNFRTNDGPIKKVKKLFVIKENENLKLSKNEKRLMNILDDDLKDKKHLEKPKTSSLWIGLYSIVLSASLLISSLINLFA